MANTKTLAIKAKLANSLRTSVYNNVHRRPALTDQAKIALFDDWLLQIWDMHIELNRYKAKRKKKAATHKERLARGYYLIKKEKKQSSKEYLKTTNNVQSS